MTDVPCGDCRACCVGERVALAPDEVALYHHEEINGVTVLRQSADGSCVYLGSDGCTIHGDAPTVCRDFDCRQYFLGISRRERRVMAKEAGRLGYHQKELVFEAGRQRLGTLTTDQREAALRNRKPDQRGVRRQFAFRLLGDER